MNSEAMKNNAVPIEHEEKGILSYGACIYCGQIYQFDTLTEFANDEELNKQATIKCKCTEAQEFQHILARKEKALKKIAKWSEDYPDAAIALNRTIDLVNDEKIKSIKIDTGYDTKFTLELTGKGNLRMKKEVKKTTSAEL